MENIKFVRLRFAVEANIASREIIICSSESKQAEKTQTESQHVFYLDALPQKRRKSRQTQHV